MMEVIKEQLALTYDGDPWYGSSIKSSLESVNPESVFRSPSDDIHSIAELLAHMISYREYAVQQLKGVNISSLDQEATFDWKTFSPNKDKAWPILLERLQSTQQDLVRTIRKHDNSILSRRVSGKPYNFNYLLSGIIHHDVYHLGQVIYIDRLFKRSNKKLNKQPFRYNFRVFSYENLVQNK